MDNPTLEELQSIGFLQMCVESIKIIYSCKKLFLQLILTLILPLLVVFYIYNMISKFSITKTDSDEFGNVDELVIVSYDVVFDILPVEYLKYWVIDVTYFTFIVIFFLFSTSTVVYTVACVFSHNQPTYLMIMSFAPKVWKKLVITLLCNFSLFVLYAFLAFITLVIFLSLYNSETDTRITKVMLSTIYIFYLIGFVYISVIAQLASIISVLEESYGFQAIAKSKLLILSKMGISATIFLEVGLSLGCVHLLIEKFVVFDESFLVVSYKVGFGGLFLALRSLLFLFGLVVQTVTYFACESCSDATSLSNHLDGGYVPLESRWLDKFEQV